MSSYQVSQTPRKGSGLISFQPNVLSTKAGEQLVLSLCFATLVTQKNGTFLLSPPGFK